MQRKRCAEAFETMSVAYLRRGTRRKALCSRQVLHIPSDRSLQCIARPTALRKAGQVASGKAKSATILSGTSDMYQADSSRLLSPFKHPKSRRW